MNIPELGDGTERIEQQARSLIPWLETPFECPECGVLCEASRAYDPQQAAFYPNGMAPSWECPNEECGKIYRREEAWHE